MKSFLFIVALSLTGRAFAGGTHIKVVNNQAVSGAQVVYVKCYGSDSTANRELAIGENNVRTCNTFAYVNWTSTLADHSISLRIGDVNCTGSQHFRFVINSLGQGNNSFGESCVNN